jgi:hypothetical protein
MIFTSDVILRIHLKILCCYSTSYEKYFFFFLGAQRSFLFTRKSLITFKIIVQKSLNEKVAIMMDEPFKSQRP